MANESLTGNLRAGRISNDERFDILQYIGEEGERRYKNNLMASGFKFDYFLEAFKWDTYIDAFQNYYYLDSGNEHLNKILKWLEYGTGLYGPAGKVIQSSQISQKTGRQLLLKISARKPGPYTYTKSVRGIKPGYMFTKAVESLENDREYLQRQYRLSIIY